MRIAIVGSRNYPDAKRVFEFVHELPPDTVVVSGGAGGVDTWAILQAKRDGLATKVYPADWGKYGMSAGFRRNQTIVDDVDCVVAFWDGVSRGTADTIAKARKAGKCVEVITA